MRILSILATAVLVLANPVLARIYRSGQIAPIYDRWFGKLGKPSQFITMMYLLSGLPE